MQLPCMCAYSWTQFVTKTCYKLYVCQTFFFYLVCVHIAGDSVQPAAVKLIMIVLMLLLLVIMMLIVVIVMMTIIVMMIIDCGPPATVFVPIAHRRPKYISDIPCFLQTWINLSQLFPGFTKLDQYVFDISSILVGSS